MSSQVPHEYLLAVTSGRIAVVGTKVFVLSPLLIVRSNRLARLNVELGISPLCLQIYFCTNTTFGMPSGTQIHHRDQHVEHWSRLGKRYPRDGSQSQRWAEASYGKSYGGLHVAMLEILQYQRSSELIQKVALLMPWKITFEANPGKLQEMVDSAINRALIKQSSVLSNTFFNVVAITLRVRKYHQLMWAQPIIS